MEEKNDTTKAPKAPKAAIIVLCVLIAGITSFVTHIATSNHTKHTATIEQSKKCAELRTEEKVWRISEEKLEFRKALASSIIKLQPKLDKPLVGRIASEIISSSKAEQLDPILMTALICVESRFDVLARGSKGEVGLMQVKYDTWKEDPILQDSGVDAKSKLYWIDLNIKCGTKIFAKYYGESGCDVVKALYRYNSGSKDLPEGKKFYEIDYANKVILTAYKIRESMGKDKEIEVVE